MPPAPRRAPRFATMAASFVLAITAGAGCEQKAAQRLIAPTLSARAPIQRSSGAPRRGQVVFIGPYEVEVVRSERTQGSAVLPQAGGAQSPTRNGLLELSIVAPSGEYGVFCQAQRQIPANADYAAVAGEPNDHLDLACDVAGPGGSATSLLRGHASENLRAAVTGPGGEPWGDLEVIATFQAFNMIRRPAPNPVAQVWLDETPLAAMILDRPERTWLDPQRTQAEQDLGFALLCGMRFLPEGIAR